jgi:uncharacterized membrane protein
MLMQSMRRSLHIKLTLLSWLIVVALWIYTILTINALPDVIPIHFNMHNEEDGWGSKTTLWALPIIATFIVALMSLVKRYPQHLNYPVAITEANRERQQDLAFSLLSGIACIIPLLFCFIIYSTAKYVREGSFEFSIVFLISAIFVPIIIYFYLAYKAR